MTFRDRLHRCGLGWHIFAGALIMAGPDILTGLSGFDFNAIWPGLGTKIGAYVVLARLAVIPVLIALRQPHHGDDVADDHEGEAH